MRLLAALYHHRLVRSALHPLASLWRDLLWSGYAPWHEPIEPRLFPEEPFVPALRRGGVPRPHAFIVEELVVYDSLGVRRRISLAP